MANTNNLLMLLLQNNDTFWSPKQIVNYKPRGFKPYELLVLILFIDIVMVLRFTHEPLQVGHRGRPRPTFGLELYSDVVSCIVSLNLERVGRFSRKALY